MEAKRSGAQSSRSGSGSESSGDSPAGSPSRSAACSAPPVGNAFANDGSFMEMFKKKMEEEERRRKEEERRKSEQQQQQQQGAAADGGPAQEKKTFSVTNFVGKRRGGAKLALKTGMVAKKQKLEPEVEAGKGDAWTKYMAEVKKYKAHQCGDDDKTRPLVK